MDANSYSTAQALWILSFGKIQEQRERERESSCLQKVIQEETNDMEDNQIQIRVIKPYPNYH